jgi:DNA-binding transcriptional LysR family regulator
VEIRQLEALVGISDHGTFSSAAEVLGTVQSNISNRIARLEDELGTELVNRATGLLTESGEIVVSRARRILGELSAIAADVSELNADIRGQVVLGMIGTAGRWIVPLLLDALRSTYPQIALRIIEGSNSTIEPQLVHGRLDLAVLAWPVDAPELTEVDLFTEDLVVIVAKDHPIAQMKAPVSFAQLAAYELLLPLRGTPIRREIDDASHAQNVERASSRRAVKPALRVPGRPGARDSRAAARRGDARQERPRRRLPSRATDSAIVRACLRYRRPRRLPPSSSGVTGPSSPSSSGPDRRRYEPERPPCATVSPTS